MAFGLFNVPLCVVGVIYLNSLEIGWTLTWLGFAILALFIPVWLYTQHELRSDEGKSDGPLAADSPRINVEVRPHL